MASDAHRPLPRENGSDGRAGLVRRYREPLIRYFARRGVPASTAEDLAQETFTSMFGLANRDHIENEEAYLFRVAANVFGQYVRKRHTHHAQAHVSIDEINIDATPAEEPRADRILEGKDNFALFKVALAELKPKTREIFLLNRLDGLTYTQIAVRFGLTPSAIEKHMIRALAHLNKRLGDWRA
jgi:RNA polymerase sigma factor (sigma-70 family)